MANNDLYNHRDMQRFIARAIGQFTPAAMIQLLDMDLGSMSDLFRQLVQLTLRIYCSRFLQRARRWVDNPEEDPLNTMRNYHNLWEGFHCDEPFHASEGRTIRYFMNSQYGRRLYEAAQQF